MYATPAPGKTLASNHVGPQEIKNKKRTSGRQGARRADTGPAQANDLPDGQISANPVDPSCPALQRKIFLLPVCSKQL
jgi:hypothetical protein